MDTKKNLFAELAEQALVSGVIGGGVAPSSAQIEKVADGLILKVQTPSLDESHYHIQVNLGNLLLYTVYNKPKEENPFDAPKDGSAQPTFVRSFPISPKVDIKKIDAVYDEGTLKVFLPFRSEEQLKPKTIDIKKYS